MKLGVVLKETGNYWAMLTASSHEVECYSQFITPHFVEAKKCRTSAAPEDFVIFTNLRRVAVGLVAGERFKTNFVVISLDP